MNKVIIKKECNHEARVDSIILIENQFFFLN